MQRRPLALLVPGRMQKWLHYSLPRFQQGSDDSGVCVLHVNTYSTFRPRLLAGAYPAMKTLANTHTCGVLCEEGVRPVMAAIS